MRDRVLGSLVDGTNVADDNLGQAQGPSRIWSRAPPVSTSLPVLPSAWAKLELLATRLGEPAGDILTQVQQSGSRYLDNANGGNINVLLQQPGTYLFTRVTLDPTGQRIISAGTVQFRSLVNGILSGRFTPIP